MPTRFDGMRLDPARHPRIWLDNHRVGELRAQYRGRSAEALAETGTSVPGLALAGLVAEDAALCRRALSESATNGPRGVPMTALAQMAVLYDWCHGLFGDAEKRTLRERLRPPMDADMKDGRLWRSFHNAGHTAAFELTLAALAIHGDDPIGQKALDFLAPELEDMVETVDRLFYDGAWAEGSDYARHASHQLFRALVAIQTATGVDAVTSSPHFQNVAKAIVYATKPDGLMFPGDDNDYPYVNDLEHHALLLSAQMFGDPYAQYYLSHCPYERFRLRASERWANVLWADPKRVERPLAELPLARIFRGKGLVIARSGWDFVDPKQTWIAFTNGDYFGDHDHLDVNAFQIHRGGALAIDSGRYDDDWAATQDADKIARSQFFNYYQRTIAHNTLLVFDPSEAFGRGLVNDGGQRHLLWRGKHRNAPEDYAQGNFPSDDGVGTSDWKTNPGRWERGDITAFEATKSFVYVRGDGTKAYASSKVTSFVRDLVYVRPDIVLVVDRIVSTNPSFAKTWLFHSVNEPRIDGASFEVTEGAGRLAGASAMPVTMTKVGGPGDEMLVAGVHYTMGTASAIHPEPLHYGETPGAWRVEQKPDAPRTDDVFANVLWVGDRDSTVRPTFEKTAASGTLTFVARAAGTVVTFRMPEAGSRGRELTIVKDGDEVFRGPLFDRVDPEEHAR